MLRLVTGWLWCAPGILGRIFILRQVGKLLGTRVEIHLVIKKLPLPVYLSLLSKRYLAAFYKEKVFFCVDPNHIFLQTRWGKDELLASVDNHKDRPRSLLLLLLLLQAFCDHILCLWQ